MKPGTEKQPRPAPEADGHAADRGPLVLVVEDDRHTRLSLQRFLQKQGWQAVGFATAAETKAWLEGPRPAAGPIGAAVIDIHLPDGDGIDLTRSLRQHLGKAVPIVIVSGDTSMETLRRLRDAGGNRFVGKPMSLAALREALQPGG
jgi:DNA-binding response OmpR family regulator